MPHATDRLLPGVPAPGPAAPGSLLHAVFAARGLTVPKDLVSPLGAGATTLWKVNAAQTLVVSNTAREATIDDAFECGRIAAAAALSAVHATAAKPLFARLTCTCPAGASEVARQELIEGVAVAMSDAGAVLAEAEVVDGPALRFDVLVAGIVRPDRVRSVSGAQPGDVLVLAGPLGAGIYGAAQVKGRLSDDDRKVLIAHATRTNAVGIAFGTVRNVHAVAEVGPAGLVHAALSLADAASPQPVRATIDVASIAALPRALALAKSGCVAPASSRNWNRDGARVDLDEAVMPETRSLVTDPQASGVLLVACKSDSVDRVLKLCTDDGGVAAAIGRLDALTEGDGPSSRRRLAIR